MDAATETANELLGLTEKLLRRYARDIDADNLTVRCDVRIFPRYLLGAAGLDCL